MKKSIVQNLIISMQTNDTPKICKMILVIRVSGKQTDTKVGICPKKQKTAKIHIQKIHTKYRYKISTLIDQHKKVFSLPKTQQYTKMYQQNLASIKLFQEGLLHTIKNCYYQRYYHTKWYHTILAHPVQNH